MFDFNDVIRFAAQSGMQRNEDGTYNANLVEMMNYQKLLEQAQQQFKDDVTRSMFDE